MSDSSFGKVMLGILGGAAVGAALGVLFAPAKGTATRRKIVKTGRDIKNTITDKLEDLVESAEELIDEIKETAADFVCEATEEEEQQPSPKKSRQ